MDRKDFALRAPKDLGLRPPGSGDPFSNAHPVTLEAASPPSVARSGPPGPSRGRKAFCFCFLRTGPGPSEVAGGGPLTERSKTLAHCGALDFSTLHRALPQGLTPGARICWGCGKEDVEKRFQRCPVCIEEQLSPSYFCSVQCQKENWPAHNAWHEQSRRAIESAGSPPQANAETMAAARAAVDDPHGQAEAKGHEALGEGRFADAAKAYNKCIKLDPENLRGYFNLANAHGCSGDNIGMLQQLLLAIPRYDEGQYGWGSAMVVAFTLLNRPECLGVPRPSWWTDSELMTLSRMVLSVVKANTLPSENVEEHAKALYMRFIILDPGMVNAANKLGAGWTCGERGAPELLEAICHMEAFVALDPGSNWGMTTRVLPVRIGKLKGVVLRLGGSLTEEPSSPSIIGDDVIINGLVQQPALNGAFVKVLSYDGANGRYKVEKQDGSIIHVKPKNIAGGGGKALARAAAQ